MHRRPLVVACTSILLLLAALLAGGCTETDAPPVSAMRSWAERNPAAAEELGDWVKSHPGDAEKFFDWDGMNPGRFAALAEWAVANPERGLGDYVAGDAKGTRFGTFIDLHRSAAESLLRWAQRHPEASRALFAESRALRLAGDELFAGARNGGKP